MGEKIVRTAPRTVIAVAGAFLFGLLTHLLYQRWSSPPSKERPSFDDGQSHPVTFIPSEPTPAERPQLKPVDLPVVRATDLRKIRELAGTQARVRGRIYRVGRSAKSNTYFLNFGPARSAFTGVIFSSTVEQLERTKIDPVSYEGREVELTGEIKDHPQYGLEMIVEDPAAIKVLN
jgi:hypothetical protein